MGKSQQSKTMHIPERQQLTNRDQTKIQKTMKHSRTPLKFYLLLLAITSSCLIASCKTCECPAYSKEKISTTESEFLASTPLENNIIFSDEHIK